MDKVEHREDRLVLAAILHSVPSEMKAGLTVKNSVKDVWLTVRTARMGDDCVKGAHSQRLRCFVVCLLDQYVASRAVLPLATHYANE